jgi:hypothetical protein
MPGNNVTHLPHIIRLVFCIVILLLISHWGSEGCGSGTQTLLSTRLEASASNLGINRNAPCKEVKHSDLKKTESDLKKKAAMTVSRSSLHPVNAFIDPGLSSRQKVIVFVNCIRVFLSGLSLLLFYNGFRQFCKIRKKR